MVDVPAMSTSEDVKKVNFDVCRELTVFGYVRMFNQSHRNVTQHVPIDINGIILKYYDTIEQRIEYLTKWLIENGAKFPKIIIDYPKYDEKGSQPFLTLFAKEFIDEDEEILFIPEDCIITNEVVNASTVGKEIEHAVNDPYIGLELRSHHSRMASYLLQERGKQESSRWYYYISILPNNYDSIPFNFTSKEKDELIGSFTLNKCNERLKSLEIEYNNLYSHVPSYAKYDWTLKDFIWARSVVITRIYGLVVRENKTSGLIPMADLLYHKNHPLPTKWTYDDNKDGYVLKTRKYSESYVKKYGVGLNLEDKSKSYFTIDIGDQIHNTFGTKCNSRYFVNYGFIVEQHNETLNNALIEIDFNQFKNNSEITQFQEKINFLFKYDQCIKKSFQISIMYGANQGTHSSTLRNLLHCLRIINATPDEFARYYELKYSLQEDPISIENEGKALKMLAYFSKQALDKFATTMEYDEQLLKNYQKYQRFSNKRNIVVVRFGEKQVLNYLIKLNVVASKYLTMTPEQISLQSEKISKLDDKDINVSAFEDYFDNVIKLLVK